MKAIILLFVLAKNEQKIPLHGVIGIALLMMMLFAMIPSLTIR